MTPAKIYPFSIPAGGSFPLLVIGDYAKILTSSGPLTLQGDSFGSIGPILAGQGVQDSPFRRLVLEDESGATNNGTILIADNAFIDDRITGSVEVIDGGKSRTLSNQAFINYIGTNGIAGNYTHLQLWNPVGSGKNVFVSKVNISGDAQGSIYLSHATVELSNNATFSRNKRINGPNGTSKLNFQVQAAQAQPGILMAINVPANTNYLYEFTEPLFIGPGMGINIVQNIIAVSCVANIEFIEEAIL